MAKQTVTPETCLTFLRAAYVEDLAQGYCTPSNYNGIPGKSMLSTVLSRLGITERDENHKTRWADPNKIPDLNLANEIFDEYIEYRTQCQENTRLNKEKKNGEASKDAAADLENISFEDMPKPETGFKITDKYRTNEKEMVQVLHAISTTLTSINIELHEMALMWGCWKKEEQPKEKDNE